MPATCLRALAGVALVLASLMAPARDASAVPGCPVGAIVIAPSDTTAKVLAKIAAPGRDRTFCWLAGIHRIVAPMRLHPGDRFLGVTNPTSHARATILGSRLVTGWRRYAPAIWVAPVRGLVRPRLNTPPGLRCLDRTHHCSYPDDVYRHHRRLPRVWSLGAVGHRGYFEDYAARRIYLHSSTRPTHVSRAVPLPVVNGRSTPFITARPGATIRNVVVEEIGVGLQAAAISCTACVVDRVEVVHAHGRGVGVDDLSTVRSSVLRANGQGGIGIGRHRSGAAGPSGTVSGNVVARNGWIRCLGICAGIKASTVIGSSIVDNLIKKNVGTGIWIDNDSIGFRVSNNDVVANRTAGIEVEISYDGVVEGNRIVGTGLRPLGRAESVGAIHVQSSGACSRSCPPGTGSGLVIRGNVVGTRAHHNAYGIILRQLSRGAGPYGQHLVREVSVVGNHVLLTRGWTGAVDPHGTGAIYGAGNTFSSNVYTVTRQGARVFRWASGAGRSGAWLTFAGWRAQGNDVDGSIIVSG
jgi:parallel beta-helix repeat protein